MIYFSWYHDLCLKENYYDNNKPSVDSGSLNAAVLLKNGQTGVISG
jgi:hypothetical protein